MEDIISNQFHLSIEAKIEHVELLAPALEKAATVMTNCLLRNGKLLVCAEGISIPLASTLAHTMLYGQQLERPGLPTLVLSPTLHGGEQHTDPFSEQIRTLATGQDTLIVFSPGPVGEPLSSAVLTAQQCGLDIVALTAPGHEVLAAQLRDSDTELFVNSDKQYRIQEIHMLALFCLCELIENKLFGG